MKILIIRFSSIGDIVLTTPVIRCLKQQTGAEIHYLTKKAFRSILESNPYIDQVRSTDIPHRELVNQLKGEKYDWIIDLHRNLRSRRFKWSLGVKSRSFDKLNLQKWLLVNLKLDRLPRVHIVDRYLTTVRHLGVKNDGAGLDYFIPPSSRVDTVQQFGVPPGGYIALVIGAAHATKRMPFEKITAVCRTIHAPILLLGGPDEASIGDQLVTASGSHVINTCGKMKLHQSASLVEQAHTVITHDTGLMHIAAAFEKKIISVWGNTVPEFGMYPYFPEGVDHNQTFEIKDLPCRPCSKIGYQQCPKGHFKCMLMQDERAIAQAIGPISAQNK